MNKSKPIQRYIETPLIYTGGNLIMDSTIQRGLPSIMDNQEDLIMDKSAEVLFRNKPKSVLNIGFGLGIIDTYIKERNPENHTIVDIHPDVVKHANSMGFNNIIQSDWRDYVEQCVKNGIKFDSIYFDTYVFDWSMHEWLNFGEAVESILNNGGVFCWFNGSAAENVDFTYKFKTQNPNWELHSETISIFDIMDRCRENGKTDFDWKAMNAKNYELNWFIKK